MAIEISLEALSAAHSEAVELDDQPGAEISAPLRPLVAALDDPDGSVRFEAMSALRDHLHPALLSVIEPLLKDNDSYIRQMAVEYYAELAK